MSANLSFRIIEPSKNKDISSLKFLFRDKYKLINGPCTLSVKDLDFIYGIAVGSNSKDVQEDCNKLIKELEAGKVVEIFLEY
jgi:hypothetical protein